MAAVQKYGLYCLSPFSNVRCRNHARILPLTDSNSRHYAWRRSDYFCPEMIPEPDYSDEDDLEEDENTASSDKEANLEIEEVTAKEDTKRRPTPTERASRESVVESPPTKDPSPNVSEDGLVVPKKPYNPYLESSQRQKLCKELKFNQKHGRSSFNPKSELQIAMDKYQEEKLRKAMQSARKTSLERILEQQAKKIEMQEKDPVPRRPSWIDRLQEQQDSWIPSDSRTDEFFRVHAKVMSHQNVDSHSTSSSNSRSSDVDPSQSPNPDERRSLPINRPEVGRQKEHRQSDQTGSH